MNTTLDCIPCLARQALEAARFATADPAAQEMFLRQTLQSFGEMDLSQSPPHIAQAMHRRLRALSQVEDPYREVKDRFNRLALELLPDYESKVRSSINSFATATRIAIAANVIDFGVNGSITEVSVREAINKASIDPLVGDLDGFKLTALKARKILFLLDNAGEIVFDRLLIEQISHTQVTAAVRGCPILNDATMADALAAGIDEFVEVVENGSDAPGTLLDECCDKFRRLFDEADLIIAKGQGNYETLSDHHANIAFLFKAKCPMVATKLGVPQGMQMILQNRRDA